MDPGTLQAVCGPLSFSASGIHAITAFYSGDANYRPSKNAILARFVVRWVPKLTAQILNSKNVVINTAPPGTVVHVRAGVAGSQGIPTGTVTFTLYYGTDCTNMVADQTVSLVNGWANSGVVTQMSSGVSFQVSYNGNATYAPVTGACRPLNVP